MDWIFTLHQNHKTGHHGLDLPGHDAMDLPVILSGFSTTTGTTYLAGVRGLFEYNNPVAPVVIDTLSDANWKPLSSSNWNVVNAPIDFAIDPIGTPYFAYIDYPSMKVAVKKYTGSWVDVGLPGFSDGNASLVHIAFQGSTPIVAYRDASLNKAVVKFWNGSVWVNLGAIAISTGDVSTISLSANYTTI